jgi:hypothetical protein
MDEFNKLNVDWDIKMEEFDKYSKEIYEQTV